MPIGDWQFWVVTLLCLAGGYYVVRPLLPRRVKADGCPHCASGAAASRAKRTCRVALTVERKHLP